MSPYWNYQIKEDERGEDLAHMEEKSIQSSGRKA
jgi:hypothetical protein